MMKPILEEILIYLIVYLGYTIKAKVLTRRKNSLAIEIDICKQGILPGMDPTNLVRGSQALQG